MMNVYQKWRDAVTAVASKNGFRIYILLRRTQLSVEIGIFINVLHCDIRIGLTSVTSEPRPSGVKITDLVIEQERASSHQHHQAIIVIDINVIRATQAL
jgi:hypothetical protein